MSCEISARFTGLGSTAAHKLVMADTSKLGSSNNGEAKDPSFADFAAQDPDSELCKDVSKLLTAVASERSVDVELLEKIIVPIFVELRANPSAQLSWYFPKPLNDYRALHAVNASRIAMHFARESGMDDARVVQLGTIGLLYDAGMWSQDLAFVLEPTVLEHAKLSEVETHTTNGADALEASGNVDPLCVTVAREHQERADGTGYPAKSGADAHHPYSRLFQIIDSFLGMVEPRPFRKVLSPVEAMQRIAVQAQRGYYHLPTFRDWIKVMGVYPVGSFVQLNTGELALVKASGGTSLRRPKVLVVADELLDFRPKPLEIDLAEESAFEVSSPFTKFPKN